MPDGYTSSGKPIPQYWLEQVSKGKQFRQQYAKESEWATWRRWYRGEWNPSILPSNVYFKLMRTLIPRIYYRNPSVSITPSKPGVENMLLCKLLERADNKIIEMIGLKGQMKRAVQHGIMFGTGFLRQGYGAQFAPVPDPINSSDPDTGTVRIRKRVEYNALVRANMPWVLAAHPGEIVVPHGSSDINSARWVCHESVRSYDDVKADPRFKNTEGLMAGRTEGRLLARSQSQSGNLREGVTLWEIRDKKTGLVFVLAPFEVNSKTEDKVLYSEEDAMVADRRVLTYPLIFNNDDEVFWGISDSQIISPQQGEINEVRTQIRNHRRIAIAKLLSGIGAISPDEESKLIDGNANGVVHVKDMNAIKELTPPQIPVALLESDKLINDEVQQLLGLGVNQFGEYAPGSADRSATEANIVNSATMIRIDERRDVCADLLAEIVADMNQLIIERWDQEMVEEVIGPAGVPIWIQFQPRLLSEARYDLKVDPDTSLPETKQLRGQRATQLYQLLIQNPFANPEHVTQFLINETAGVDASFLLKNPIMQTSPENPMTVQQASAGVQQLPGPALVDMLSRNAA